MSVPLNPTKQICSNLYRFYSYIGKNTHVQSGKKHNIQFIRNDKGLWPSHVFNSLAQPVGFEDQILTVSKDIDAGFLPSFWIVEQNEQFMQLLDKHDFKPIMLWKGMAMNISSLTTLQPLPGLEIKKVKNQEQLTGWAEIVNQALLTSIKMRTETLEPIYRNPELCLYVGYFDGKAVAASAMFFTEQSAGIYFICTLQDYRQLGIGRQITYLPLLEARNKGYNTAVLHATKLGEFVYRKLGFEEFCRIYIYCRVKQNDTINT